MKVRCQIIKNFAGLYVLSSNSTKKLDKLIGKDLLICIDDKRSTPQNRYLWGVVYKTIADRTGNDKDSLHHYFKSELLSDKSGVIPTIKSTKELTKQEFIEYYRSIAEWAMNFDGIFVPEPNESELWRVEDE